MPKPEDAHLRPPRRSLLIDLGPLSRSRDFRRLVLGEGVAILGSQVTTVAVPWQVYRLTHSSFDVGLVSLAQLLPLLFGSLLGGSVADAVDRRRLLLAVESLMALTSAGLALNADLGPSLWPLFVLPAIGAALSGCDGSTRNALVPNMVGRSDVSAANAIFQALFQVGTVVGPAVAGLLLAGAGVRFVYWVDVATFAVALAAVFRISPQPPKETGDPPGLRSIVEGFRFLRGRQQIQGAYVIDLDAMVFGMPPRLVPCLGDNSVRRRRYDGRVPLCRPGCRSFAGRPYNRLGRPGTPPRPRRDPGRDRVGAGHKRFRDCPLATRRPGPARRRGLGRRHIGGVPQHDHPIGRNRRFEGPLGWVPDRGRLGWARLGDFEAGTVAAAFGDTASVISGGLACVVGAVVLAAALPGFRRQRADAT